MGNTFAPLRLGPVSPPTLRRVSTPVPVVAMNAVVEAPEMLVEEASVNELDPSVMMPLVNVSVPSMFAL